MRKKGGATLAELVIVLAIVSVMSVMVVSFTILCNGWVQIGIQRYRLVQDQRTATHVLHEFVSYFDDAEFVFSSDNTHELTATSRSDSSLSYTLRYEENTLRYTLPDREAVYPVEHITTLTFLLRRPLNSNDMLICCSVSYTLPAVSMQRKDIHKTFITTVAVRSGG